MGRSFGVVLAAFGLSACSLLVGTSGLEGDPSTTPGASDAGGDVAVTIEGGPPPDSGSGEAGDAGGGDAPPCAVAHTFCDDFDTGDTNAVNRWDDGVLAFGTLAMDTTRFVSAPRSLSFKTSQKAGVTEAFIERTLPMPSGRAHVELEMFVGTESGAFTEVDPVGVELNPPPSGYSFNGGYLVLRDGELRAQAFAEATSGSNYNVTKPIGAIQRDHWYHVVIDIDGKAAGGPKLDVTVDGKTVTMTLPPSSPTSTAIGVGAVYADSSGGVWPFNFDDVVVDTQ
jgi:hypothetical protein